jgi:hypothetical protein
MASDAREDFERRILAKVRSSLDYLDEEYPDGWEIEEFVLTFRFYTPLDPETPLRPWHGGRYVGMYPDQFTTGSSPSSKVDELLLSEALRHTERLNLELEYPEDDENEEDINSET